jgi:hypothetical protein
MRTDMTKLIVTFRNFANATRNSFSYRPMLSASVLVGTVWIFSGTAGKIKIGMVENNGPQMIAFFFDRFSQADLSNST